jgi:4-diphosphocytidyl-2-C-methyl-D-erythritol kinase
VIFEEFQDDLGRAGIKFSTILGTEIDRLKLIITDVESWGFAQQPKLLSTKQANELIFGFSDGTRGFIRFEKLPFNRVRFSVRHENAAQRSAVHEQFWSSLIEQARVRLNVENLVVASAPGKLNLAFRVGARRADGYHSVVSVYQELSLRETVVVSANHEWSLALSGSLPEDRLLSVPLDGNNLAFKAAKKLAELAGLVNPYPVAIGIDKQVPVAGGMGGGSADAAATLIALNELWRTGISRERLVAESVHLGADVPFAVLGGTAIGRGVGEKLEPLASSATLHWVMIPNAGGLSTATVFARLDELRAQTFTEIDDETHLVAPHYLIDALAAGNPFDVAEFMHNDLEEAALDLMPSLAITLQDGMRSGALRAMVSGSGPTVALLAGSEASAIDIAKQMRLLGYEAITAQSATLGARIDE